MIPINEQPYPLPDGWQWVTLDSVAECLDNLRSPVNAAERAKRLSKIPYYGATGQVGWIDDFLTDEQLVLLGEDGAPFLDMFKDKAYIIEGKAWVNNHAHILRSRFGSVGNKFLCHYLNAFDFSDYVNGTTRLKLTQAKMKKIPIPLPPFDEQQRIVALLDEVFAKLDEAKALAQSVVDGSELRRTAILHKAFTGELTKLWRDEHETTLDSWKKKFLSDALISSKQKTNDFVSSDLKYVGLENMEKNGGRISFQTADEIRSTKNIFRIGDLLYGKLRPYLNKHGVAKFDGVCSTDILVFKANEQAEIEFINYFLSLPKFIEYAVANSKGINLPRVSEKIILRTEIFLPPLQEQKEIIRLLDDLLSREQRTKELAGKILERVELLEKSVSTRVFHGNLK